MPKVHVLNQEREYEEMFRRFGWEVTPMIAEADLIQFTGGPDVPPHLYGEPFHPRTSSNLKRTDREMDIFNEYKGKKKLAGICYGGQILNVLCGGAMYQDHSGHPYIHKAWVYSQAIQVVVSSTHHQLMRPGENGIVLMAANEGVKAQRVTTDNEIVTEVPEYETEAVFYPDDGVLCFQPHPEFSVRDDTFKECATVYFSFLEELLKDDVR